MHATPSTVAVPRVLGPVRRLFDVRPAQPEPTARARRAGARRSGSLLQVGGARRLDGQRQLDGLRRLSSLRQLARRGGALAVTVLAALLALLGAGSPASAASGPTLITIAGDSLRTPIALHSDGQADLFNALLRQLSWMQGAAGTPMKVDQGTLGHKFTVTVAAAGSPVQVYDIYPEATGGPRAFRPAAQPQGKSSDAWFYAAVSLPSVLRAAGVPLSDTGIAGPDHENYGSTVTTESVSLNARSLLTQLRTVVLTSVGTSVGALLLLFGAARFSRARYRRRASS